MEIEKYGDENANWSIYNKITYILYFLLKII